MTVAPAKTVVGFGGLGTDDGFGVDAETEALLEEETGGLVVGQHVDGLDVVGSDLETDAGLAGADEDGEAPAAGGLFDHNHAVAAFDAEDEAGLELVDDHETLGLGENAGWNRDAGIALKGLENRLAGFDFGDEVGARGLGKGVDGREGKERGDEQRKKFFHGEERRLHDRRTKHDGMKLESAEWAEFRSSA